jgi:HSP20 family protein
MAEAAAKFVAKNDGKGPTVDPPASRQESWPLYRLRSEINRLFDDFGMGSWLSQFRRGAFDVEPFWSAGISWAKVPAVDIAETAKGYEITAELPGIDEKNIEVKYVDGALTIKGEKKDEREEKKENYHLSERSYGAFQRSFRVPDGIDAEKVEASFKNGVLTVTMPKSPEVQKKEKHIEIKQG